MLCLLLFFGFLTAPVVYPFAYLIQKITKKKVLWIYHDDEDNDGCHEKVSWFNKGKCNFWVKYKWSALRNPAWNLHALLVPKSGTKTRINSKGWLERDGSEVHIWHMAGLKYVDEEGNYQDNKGKYISLKHSIFGKMNVWYKVENRKYFRFSRVGKFLGFWYEFQMGTNDNRYLLKFKLKNKKIYERLRKVF